MPPGSGNISMSESSREVLNIKSRNKIHFTRCHIFREKTGNFTETEKGNKEAFILMENAITRLSKF